MRKKRERECKRRKEGCSEEKWSFSLSLRLSGSCTIPLSYNQIEQFCQWHHRTIRTSLLRILKALLCLSGAEISSNFAENVEEHFPSQLCSLPCNTDRCFWGLPFFTHTCGFFFILLCCLASPCTDACHVLSTLSFVASPFTFCHLSLSDSLQLFIFWCEKI